MKTMEKAMRKLDDMLMMTLGATAVALTVLIVSYANIGEVNTVQAKEVAQPEQCTDADIAHIPYPDEYEFYCVGNTLEIWDKAEDEYITSEIRGEQVMIQAEDGSFVPPSFYGE